MKTKKIVKVLASAALVATAITVVACTDSDTDETAVNRIILDADGTTVTDDFTVVTSALGEDVSWSSSDDSVVAFHEIDDEMYACITRPSETTDVTLTATVGDATKDFSVIVNPVTTEEIAEDYDFDNDSSVVTENFDLPSSYDYVLSNTYDGDYATDTATISWSSSDSSLVEVSGETAVVTTTKTKTEVTLTATFTYDSTTFEEEYTVYAYYDMTASESLEYYYQNVGGSETFTLTGYVSAVAGYDDSYGEASFYMIDESLEGGYYVYDAYMDEDVYDSLEYGTRIQVTDVTNKTYNGLVEANYGGTATVITDDDTLAELDSSYTYEALDSYLYLEDTFDDYDSVALTKKTGSLVSLTSWYVSSVETLVTDTTSDSYDSVQTLLVLKNEEDGDLSVEVAVSEYLTGLTGVTTPSVGDYVDITGVLSYDSSTWQIIADSSSSITVTSDDSDASISDGEAISSILENIDLPSSAASDTEIDTSLFETGSVTVSYALYDNYSCATLENNVLYLTPTDTLESVIVQVTFTSGDTTFTFDYTIACQTLTDQEMAETEIADVDIADSYSDPESVELASNGSTFTDVAFTYSISASSDTVYISTVDGTDYLVIIPTTAAQSFTLTITATCGDATTTSTIAITVDAYTTTSLSDAISGSLTTGSYYYITGVVTSIYKAYYGNIYIGATADATSTLFVYGSSDVFGTYYGSIDSDSEYKYSVGDQVVLYGEYVLYGTTYELSSTTIVSVTPSASSLLDSAEALFSSAYSDTTTITLPDNVTATVTSGSDVVTVSGSTVTITPTSTSTDVELSLSATGWDTTTTGTVSFTAYNVTDSTKVSTELDSLDIATSYLAYTSTVLSTTGTTYSDVTLS